MNDEQQVIDDTQAELLHERVLECADADVNATILHANHQLPDDTYTSFKQYIKVRENLDKLSAVYKVEFEIANSTEELEAFCLAAKHALPGVPDFTANQLSKYVMKGSFFIYAYEFITNRPLGVICYLVEDDVVSIEEYGIMPNVKHDGANHVFELALEIVRGNAIEI
jgi:hypothetical protein